MKKLLTFDEIKSARSIEIQPTKGSVRRTFDRQYSAIFPLLLLALALAACGTSPAGNSTAPNGSNAAERSLPALTQLVIGTFKLEGTKEAVTPEQASDLLPLWEVYSTLTQSDTAAQEEIDALVQQIQDTMSEDQRKAIEEMKITPQDMAQVMRDQGIEISGGGQNLSPEQIATAQARRSEGGFPGGGFPGGGPGDGTRPDGGVPGGGFPGGTSENRNSGSNGNSATQGRTGRIDRVPTPLLNALIELLKERKGS